MTTYTTLVAAIKAECAKINLSYSSEGDGRILSAVKEPEYLECLTKGLSTYYPEIEILQSKKRGWYDIRIGGLPINLKITSGGTDNAFNKTAILFTLSGKEPKKNNMNYNQFLKAITANPIKNQRDRMTEYHYLVVNKQDGAVLFKSILDIHTYKTNPCNNLQINWTHEFAHIDVVTADTKYKDKLKSLLHAIQASVKQLITSMTEFAEADLNAILSP